VAAVLDDAGLDKAHVVGFSLGGLVAQSLAVRHPARVDRLVLASTYAVMNPQARLFLDAVHEPYADGSLTERQMFGLICPWLFSTAFLADPANAGWISYPDDAGDEQAPEDWSRLYRAQRAFDGTRSLADIGASTLVLSGSEDRLVSRADAELLARRIPGARHDRIAGAGHLLNFEEPQRFLDAVEAHLAAHHRHHGPGRR
jgi:3-oxoadipate enol-lactonase